jgi:hypothetical protein
MKVEIKNYRASNKGAFIAFFTLLIDDIQVQINGAWQSLQLELTDCKYFGKGDSRWFKYADKEYKNKMGETAYSPMVKFSLPPEIVLEALKLQEGGNAQIQAAPRQEDIIPAQPPFGFGRAPF